MQNINEEIFHAGVRHQIYLQRYSTQVVQEILDLLIENEIDIISKLSKADLTDFSQRRLQEMLREIRQLNVQA